MGRLSNADFSFDTKYQKQIVDAIESVQLFASLFKVGNGCRCQSLECLKHDTGLNSNEVGCKRIYREDHMDLKRQLKFLNKLAKKTIQTKYGDTYDCINLYEQPFFNYYSLKSHIYDFPVRSASNPEGIRDQKSSPLFNPSNFWLNGKGCPVGMVPIRRNTMADLKRAKLATKIHNSKYKPLTVDKPGTHVNPTLYNDTRTRLYTFTKDSSNGNWFLKFGQDETVIGFWPKNVFTALGDGANYVEWGGEVFSPPDVPSPPMGSGYSERLEENTKYDAYCRQIKTINETEYVVNAADTENFSDIVQYQVIDEGRVGADQHLVLFGGVGGYIGE
ncbi:uncharacterized protein LOC142613492 [Castanea sativa]|uniref:uncharacterized protein LOC142613492 n=1 Tax=Castanea sativa TaxID=21020 RepID=UPI003F64CCAB